MEENGGIEMIRLPKIFGKGCVFQQQVPTAFWGWAQPEENIRAWLTGDGQTIAEVQGKADQEGSFRMEFPPLQAGGPFMLHVKGEQDEIQVEQVWAGDVYVCSGQSNMELPMRRVRRRFPEEYKTGAPKVHLYKVYEHYEFDKPLKDHEKADWTTCTPENLQEISAFSYFLGKELSEKRGIPVGILNLSLGGTPAQAWMSQEALGAYPNYLEELKTCQNPEYTKNLLKTKEQEEASWYGNIADLEKKEPVSEKTWHSITLPGIFEEEGLKDFCGSLCLKKNIQVPEKLAGREGLLEFGTLVDSDEMYINGVKIGETGYQYPPRRYPIPAGLLKAGENEVRIHLICRYGTGRVTLGKKLQIGWYNADADGYDPKAEKEDPEKPISLEGTWKYQVLAACGPAPEQVFLNRTPGGLYQGMVAPCQPYTVKGAFWYQGESNDTHPENYRELLQSLIADWRKGWENPKLPFTVVQLPNCGVDIAPGEAWPKIREAQRQAAKLSNVGVSINLDLGEDNDLHPLNKKETAHRAALVMEQLENSSETGKGSPCIQECIQNPDGSVCLKFDVPTEELCFASRDGVTGELAVKETSAKEKLGLFEIQGPDGNWSAAQAEIVSQGVYLSVGEAVSAAGVRYAWNCAPGSVLLYRRNGLPAGPFMEKIQKFSEK